MTDWFAGKGHLVVNTIGHGAGVVVFALFLGLVFRHPAPKRLKENRLSILAALLALLWNLASLCVLVLGSTGNLADQMIATAGFSILSLLPAVLLHICLRGRLPLVIASGYALSGIAMAAHAAELLHSAPAYHRVGLTLITLGFGVLTAVAVAKVLWSDDADPRRLSSRILATMSLFLFAISFGHFSAAESHQVWSAELAFHHAGIPLALLILLQDYRFVLVDAFIRFLVNVLLAGAFAVAIAAFSSSHGFVGKVVIAGLLLAGFALSRQAAHRLLTRIVFRRPDTDLTARRLRALGAQAADENAYFSEAARTMAAFMEAQLIAGVEGSLLDPLELYLPTLVNELPDARGLQRLGIVVVVPLRLTHGVVRYVLLGERRGGRRYLSEDLEALARLAACVTEQIEHIREVEMRRLVSQAELRALQAQIHPHFLFNALNTLYGVIPREAAAARRLLIHLADIFRYFLQTDQTFVSLEQEIRIVKAYLSIEELRLGGKLRVELDIEEAALSEPIPVLSIQPLVENAVKHGVAARPEGGIVRIEIKRETGGLRIRVRDTGPGFAKTPSAAKDSSGVGLENVRRRLQLCCGPNAELSIETGAEGTTVSFFAPADRLAATTA